MPYYRVTFQFSGGGEGWSETHMMFQTDPNFAAWQLTLANVASARAEMLGDPFYVYAIRVARFMNDDGTKSTRAVRLYKGRPGGGNVGWYSSLFGRKRNGSEPSVVALQGIGFAARDTPQPYTGNTNQTFLGGPQDDAVDNDGGVFPANTNLGAAFPLWVGAMKAAQMGWGAAQILENRPLQTIAQSAGTAGTVTLTLQAATTATVGQWYPCRIKDINNGRSPLNGAVICYVKDPTTLITKEIIGVPTTQTGGSITIYKQLPKFIYYGDIELQLTAVKHKRGKSPAAKPGRARKRIRG